MKNGVNAKYRLWRYFFFVKHQDWIKKYGYEWIGTRAEMINISFRDWGHKYIYNKEELTRRLLEVGFQNVYKQSFRKSKFSELRNRETRKDSKLIFEALK